MASIIVHSDKDDTQPLAFFPGVTGKEALEFLYTLPNFGGGLLLCSNGAIATSATLRSGHYYFLRTKNPVFTPSSPRELRLTAEGLHKLVYPGEAYLSTRVQSEPQVLKVPAADRSEEMQGENEEDKCLVSSTQRSSTVRHRRSSAQALGGY